VLGIQSSDRFWFDVWSGAEVSGLVTGNLILVDGWRIFTYLFSSPLGLSLSIFADRFESRLFSLVDTLDYCYETGSFLSMFGVAFVISDWQSCMFVFLEC